MARTTRAHIDAAVSRALEARLTILDMRDGFWAVESQSKPGTAYMLELDETGTIFCPCEGFQYNAICTHKVALGIHIGTIPASWIPAVDVPIGVDIVAVAS